MALGNTPGMTEGPRLELAVILAAVKKLLRPVVVAAASSTSARYLYADQNSGGGVATDGTVQTATLTVANNNNGSIELGLMSDIGSAEVCFGFARGSLRGAGRLRIWSDGTTPLLQMVEASGDDPLPGAAGDAGWQVLNTSGAMLLKWTSDNSGNSTTFNFVYLTTGVI